MMLCGSATASDLSFRRYGPDEGLSQVSVLALHQDTDGFLWVGTRFGLNVFDGQRFKIFSHDPWDSTTLIHNHINVIIAGEGSALWIGTAGGLCKYDAELGIFQPIHHGALPDSEWNISGLAKDQENNIWVASSDGVFIIPANTNRPLALPNDKATNAPDVQFVVADHQQKIWLGGNSGFFSAAWQNGTFLIDRHSLNAAQMESGRIAGIYPSEQGDFWLSTDTYLWYYDPATGLAEAYKNEYKSSDGTILFACRGIVRGLTQELWISSYLGLFVFDLKQKKYVERICNVPDDDQSLSDNSIHSMWVTDGGDRWVGTYSGGLNYYSPFQDSFELFQHSPQSPSINSDIINAFAEGTGGLLYVGTSRGGLNIYDPAKGQYRAVLEQENIRHLLMDRQGDLWVSSLFNGVIKYDVNTNQPIYYKTHEEDSGKSIAGGVATNHIFFEDNEGTLWIAAWDKLYRYNRLLDIFDEYPYPINKFWEDHTVRDVLQVKEELWLMTATGIQVFDISSRKFTKSFKHLPGDRSSLPSNVVTSGVIDLKGNLWVATFGGLSRYIAESSSFQNFDINDGLPSNMVLCMLVDNKNKLWLSTSNGLAFFDQEKLEFKIFDKSNNLQGNAFRDVACLKCEDGSLLFGGVKGFNRFDPLKIVTDTTKLQVVLTDLMVFNKKITPKTGSYLNKELRYLDTLRLNYDQNVFTIGYTAPDFFNPNKNQFAYMLEGFDDTWSEVGRVRTATYTNLSSGNYTFKVKVANDDGIYTDEVTSLMITIIPPFWETTIFRMLLLAILVFVIGATHQIRVRSLVRQRKQLDEKVKIRTKIIDEQKRKLEIQNSNLIQAEEEVRTANDSLQKANDLLEEKVTERTKKLKQQNKKIQEYAFLNSHKVRSPLVRILGLVNIYQSKKLSSDEVEEINTNIYHSAMELDEITRKINEELDDVQESKN